MKKNKYLSYTINIGMTTIIVLFICFGLTFPLIVPPFYLGIPVLILKSLFMLWTMMLLAAVFNIFIRRDNSNSKNINTICMLLSILFYVPTLISLMFYLSLV